MTRCPTCDGTGYLEGGRHKIRMMRERTALDLVDQGFSYREVADTLGYKSQNSIYRLVKKREKTRKSRDMIESSADESPASNSTR